MKHLYSRTLIRVLMILSIGLLTPSTLTAQEKTKEDEKKEKKKTIEELTKDHTKINGIFTFYQNNETGKLQLEISENQLNKEYIHFVQVANGADVAGLFRGQFGGSKVFKISKYFNKIEFTLINTNFYFDKDNAISKSKEANISNAVIASIKIEAKDEKSGKYLIKADDLFLKETFVQIKPAKSPKQKPEAFSLGKLDDSKSKINQIKNYTDNVVINVEYVYSSPSVLNKGSNSLADGRNVSVQVYHSLIAVPENNYEPRFDDPRVGYFLTFVEDQTAIGAAPYRDLIHRWDLKKKNPEADISEPVKPITWWLENSTPLEWRETITQAVLEWNKGFEAAGFKNAMVVKVQPDDATWDAGDINYNVLRWTASPTPPFGGYGPSFVNPLTGEILGADIMLEYVHFKYRALYDKIFTAANSIEPANYSSFQNSELGYCSMGHLMADNTMLGKTFLAASNASEMELDRIKKEGMIALIMHEVGHTLGLNHNMKSSQLFSPKQLEDADLIKGKALAGSVMDYTTINLTLNQKKQGQYFDTSIGPYDVWAIQFGYTPFKSESVKQELLLRSTEPELIFGNDADDMRSPGKAIDPRVMVGDISNDQISYSIDRIKLIDKTMSNLKENLVSDGDTYQELNLSYRVISSQRAHSSTIISRFIGGVYVDRSVSGQQSGKQPYTPVSKKDQKRAMDALSEFTFAPNAFATPNELYNYLAMQRRGFNFFSSNEDPKIHDRIMRYQKNILDHLLHKNTLQRIVDSELYGNEYPLSEMMTDLNNAIFKEDIGGDVNSFRQNLQMAYTKKLIGMVAGKSKNQYSTMAQSMALYNLKSIKSMATATGNISSLAHKQHLNILINNTLKEVK